MTYQRCAQCQEPTPPAALFKRGDLHYCFECFISMPALEAIHVTHYYCTRCNKEHVAHECDAQGFTQWKDMGL